MLPALSGAPLPGSGKGCAATAIGVLAAALGLFVDVFVSPSDSTGRGAAFYALLWHVPGLAFVPDPQNPEATAWAWAYLAAVLVAGAALAFRAGLLMRADRLRPPGRRTDPRTRRRVRRARQKAARRA